MDFPALSKEGFLKMIIGVGLRIYTTKNPTKKLNINGRTCILLKNFISLLIADKSYDKIGDD